MAKAVDHVCEVIYERIFSGHYQPGQRLREEVLTELTGVSRTPVREALRRLVQEGFVVIEDNRGASIPKYSTKDMDEIYGLRTLLESHAARRAAERITPEQVVEMKRINDKFRNVANATKSNRDDPERFMKLTRLNQDFHQVIFDAADNRQLANIVKQLARTALSATTYARFGKIGQSRSVESHDEIIRALKAGRPDWAEAAMRSHVHHARATMRES